MRPLLLDTIVLLWWLAGDGRLDLAVVHRIKLPKHHVYVSVATAWEICALEREGQASFGKPARDCLPEEISANRFEWLPIDQRHIFLAQQLPRAVLDPYDRLILAQASVEGLALATTNDQMRAPGVEIIDGRRRADPAGNRAASQPPPPSAHQPEDRPLLAWNAFPWGGATSKV